MPNQFQYEPIEKFGEGLTTRRPWNNKALAAVAAALIGELVSGRGPAGQVLSLVSWYLQL